jgi:hypothetical protein
MSREHAGVWFFLLVLFLGYLAITVGMSPEEQRAIRVFLGACP